MTRESRLIVTLLVISGIGLVGLNLIARQYKKSLPPVGAKSSGGEAATVRALRLVDGFLAARRAAKSVIDRYPRMIEQLPAEATSVFRSERENAFAAHGLTYVDYVAVRGAWRTFRAGGVVDDAELAGVLRARREELEAASLGPAEMLDDAVR